MHTMLNQERRGRINYAIICEQDLALEERVNISGQLEYTGRTQRRLVLVLDCLVAHDFNDRYADLINLQHYVIKEKKLTEKESIVIALDIVRIVESLHKVHDSRFIVYTNDAVYNPRNCCIF